MISDQNEPSDQFVRPGHTGQPGAPQSGEPAGAGDRAGGQQEEHLQEELQGEGGQEEFRGRGEETQVKYILLMALILNVELKVRRTLQERQGEARVVPEEAR